MFELALRAPANTALQVVSSILCRQIYALLESHSHLPTYFMGFSMWAERNVCLSWDETQDWLALLGVRSVPVIYDGIFDESRIRALYDDADWYKREGYVVRIADHFAYSEFRKSVAKFVRKEHVQTVKHWMHGQPIERNLLAR